MVEGVLHEHDAVLPVAQEVVALNLGFTPKTPNTNKHMSTTVLKQAAYLNEKDV